MITLIKPRRKRWVKNVARKSTEKNCVQFQEENLKRLREKRWHRQEDNIKMNLKDKGSKTVC
jgi:hypothetical protein